MARKGAKWRWLSSRYGIATAIATAIILLAGVMQSWDQLGWPKLATHAWVKEVQAPLVQSISDVGIGWMQLRIGTIKDNLVAIENQKSKTFNAGERKRLELQADDLKTEKAELEAKIKAFGQGRK